MTETLFIIAFFVWYFLSLAVSENAGKKSRLGVEWTFFVSFLFSPITGWLLARWQGKK
ncbi:MAG: hypothetical protein R6T99_09370 [Bacteroidales bacterium]